MIWKLTIFGYNLKLSLKVNKAAHKIQEEKANETISDHNAQN